MRSREKRSPVSVNLQEWRSYRGFSLAKDTLALAAAKIDKHVDGQRHVSYCAKRIVNYGEGAPITMALSQDSPNQVRILRSGV